MEGRKPRRQRRKMPFQSKPFRSNPATPSPTAGRRMVQSDFKGAKRLISAKHTRPRRSEAKPPEAPNLLLNPALRTSPPSLPLRPALRGPGMVGKSPPHSARAAQCSAVHRRTRPPLNPQCYVSQRKTCVIHGVSKHTCCGEQTALVAV